jgi:hypothetical protein
MTTKKVAVKATPKLPSAAPVIGGGPKNLVSERRNSPPDGRMFRPLPFVGKVERGYIKEMTPPGPGVCYFMYNPNQFSYNFQISQDLVAPDATAMVPTSGPVGGTTVSFQLLFVRQFEVAYGGSTRGVWEDLDALRYLIGIDDPTKIGYGWLKVLMFVFGTDPSMVFYGAITNIGAQLSLFSEKMVPMAATADISVTWFPPSFNINAAAQEAASVNAAKAKAVTTPAAQRQTVNKGGPSIASIY